MRFDGRRLPAGCGCFIACLIVAASAAGQDAPGSLAESEPRPDEAPALSIDQLAKMTWPELECLYRESPAGTIPEGYAAGKAIYCPCGRLAGLRSKATGVVWRGKVFDGADGTLVNQWCGFRAIHARVTYGPSWLDGDTSIVMDYGQTSRVWADVRDEAREVAPGVYLGRMYRRKPGGPEFQCYFALQACPR